MFPGESDEDVCEKVAEFFNKISREYQPCTEPRPGDAEDFPKIETYQISGRLRKMKIPRGCLKGDVPPILNRKYSDFIALPLTYIYNLIRETCRWPKLWKEEQVTVIPKNTCPTSLGELRNLSCTPVYSKLLESFVMDEAKKTVKLSEVQYGGQKGCGVDHFLVDTWNQVLQDLEDHRAGSNILSIDFEKAFNRMDHSVCLNELRRLNATSGTCAMVGAFLHGRTMVVRNGSATSKPRPVPGGSPQGSIMANFLFCVTANSLAQAADQDEYETGPNRSPPRENNIPPIGAEVATSTPLRNNNEVDSSHTEEMNDTLDQSFRFFRLRRPFTLESSGEESFLMPQDLIDNELGVPDRWKDENLTVKCYIDDYSGCEKVRIEGSVFHLTQNQQKTLVHATKSQGLLTSVERIAAEKFMKVNTGKTQLLCINSSRGDVRSYINTSQKRIVSGDSLKLLGFTFGRRPNVNAHLAVLMPKLRRKLWMISHLKSAGMKPDYLLVVYLTAIRPIAEFAAVCFHSMLTRNQSEELENYQRTVLKSIFGFNYAYQTILEHKAIPTLQERREKLVEKFAIKTAKCARFGPRWFPLQEGTGYDTRRPLRYKEFACRTDRLRNSPLHYMRRKLNEN